MVCVAGCASGDPREEVLIQRARWNVQLLDWVQTEEGSLNLSTRISGPASSKIDRLTVLFELQDAAGAAIGRRWHTYDLSEMPRGGPADKTLRLDGAGLAVEAIRLDPLPQPEPAEERHIEELRGLAPSG